MTLLLFYSDVRLNGTSQYVGTVEVTEDGATWQTTCGINLSFNDAIVICRQLNFIGANRRIQDSPFGNSKSPTIRLDCDGSMIDMGDPLFKQSSHNFSQSIIHSVTPKTL